MLSVACKYSIRAILYLSIYAGEDHKLGVKKIAEDLEIPQAFLAQLLRQLTANKLVSSFKGPNGGFYLSKENKEQSVWDIICCIDTSYKFDECFIGLAQCNDINPCPIHYIVSPFKEDILKDFKHKTIETLGEEIKKNGTAISLKFLTPENSDKS